MCSVWFHFFYLFIDLVSSGKDLDHILMCSGDPGGTYSDFKGSWLFSTHTLKSSNAASYTAALLRLHLPVTSLAMLGRSLQALFFQKLR